jgi:hypothetical protein
MHKTHGESKTRLYKAWDSMKDRIFHHKKYSHLTFCDEWCDFLTFKEWALQNSYKEGLSLDRVDNSKGYEPSNCRWVTRSGQSYNRTFGKYVTIDGVTKNLSQWAREYGISVSTIYTRIKRGLSVEESITKKVRGYKNG